MSSRRTAPIAVFVGFAFAVVAGGQAPDRSKPPQPGLPPELRLPPIQTRTLSNGVPVWIVELHEVPVVQVTLLVETGSAADPADKPGLASMTAAMLDEGAGSRTALEIADAIDYLGASLGTSSSFDASAIRLHVPVARLDLALPVMADVALRPTFPEKELERLRQERLTSILQARDDPQAIASFAFPRIVFGAPHRYGTPAGGTAASVKAMTVADLRAFYAARYRPAASSVSVVVVGDVTPDSMLPKLERAFGAWKADGPQPTAASVPQAPQLTRRQVFIIDKPGAAQSQIRIGWVGVPRSTPDYFTLQVLNTILGGSFSSRLNLNLREQHGYAYGAGSGFDMRGAAGPFFASAGVQTDKTADALKEFFVELAGILKPVPADELARAKNYLALGFPGDFETTGDISRRLEEMIVYDLPGNYFDSYVSRIQAVSAADAQRAAQKYIQPDKFAVVVVGDRATIEAPIRALNLGPVTLLSVEQVFGPQ